VRIAWIAGVVCALACSGEVHALRGGTDYGKCLKAATFGITEALDKGSAVPEAKGCVPVGIEIEEEDGKIIWSMEFSKGDKILEINFEVTEGSRWPLENEDHDKSAEAKAAKISLKEAIQAATSKVQGQAVEANLLLKESKPIFEVKVFTAKKKVVVISVDGVSGEVTMLTKFDPVQKSAKAPEKSGESPKGDKATKTEEKEDR